MSETAVNVISFISEKYVYFEYIPACVGTFLNVFHLIILSQKSMRTSSINAVMIGIAICDFLNMVYILYNSTSYFVAAQPECINSASYLKTILGVLVIGLRDICRRLTSWLGVLLATIRLIIVKSTLNPKLNKISKPFFGRNISLICLILSILISAFYFGCFRFKPSEIPWIPADHCSGYPSNYSEVQFQPEFSSVFMLDPETASKIFYITDGASKITSAILLPILTIFLIIELNLARKTISVAQLRNPSNSSKTDNTTKLVIFMTITFVIADGPIGVISLAQGILAEKNMMKPLMTLSMILSILGIFITLNSSIHCIICLVASSPYRETVKSLFCCQKDDSNTVISKT
ncbi:hypothetical protein CRE_24319 [Caenorhabditis remanei]|uniref:G-protein coupled receptors family 1 profile domain-containing protein n=1 Tax=Caenorhabditis remanei TaxID=31234 RepID=E3NQ73_CAERE|nr:hypothetical protein CRE_24319 [Caenorhabditis remanei]